MRWPTSLVRRGAFALALSAVYLGGTGDARAEDAARVEWRPEWPRARWWEVANIVALTAASLTIDSQWKPPSHATWRDGIAFDEAIRQAFRGRTAAVQLTASTLGDRLYEASVYVPYIVDNFFVALWLHDNPDVAVQMTLIDMQSLGLAGVVTLASEHAIPRERPFARDCGSDGDVHDSSGDISERCGHGDDFKSFYSGHAAASATMAGLTCLHHRHLPLYGGGGADIVPCLTMVAVAAVTGATRIVADRHWASDVMLGWAVGGLSGYVLPSVLHYGWGGGRALGEVNAAGVSFVPHPQMYPNGAGMAITGIF